MSIQVKIFEDGKEIATYNPKAMKTKKGKPGFYGSGVVVIAGKACRANLLFYEM